MVANILSADPPDISINMPCLTPILAGDSSDSRNSSYLIRIISLKLGYGYSVKVALLLTLSILSGLQIYGGPGSLSHDFKIWPITLQGSGPIHFSCEKNLTLMKIFILQ